MSAMVPILRTGQLYQLDMADAALKEARLPHFLREESFSGLSVAMPAAPSMAPGVWWVVLVPQDCVEEARRVLSELPFEITLNPGFWDCQPAGPAGPLGVWWRIAAVLALGYSIYATVRAFVHSS